MSVIARKYQARVSVENVKSKADGVEIDDQVTASAKQPFKCIWLESVRGWKDDE